jgi:hypothetical protein
MTNEFGNPGAVAVKPISPAVVPKYHVSGGGGLIEHLVPLAQVETFLSELTALYLSAQDLGERMDRLATNMTNATPVWEDRGGEEKYLRLVYPSENGRRRRRYVGNKVARVREALQQVENYKTYCQLEAELARVQEKIDRAVHGWHRLMANLGDRQPGPPDDPGRR